MQVGDSDAVVALPMGLHAPTTGRARIGGERTNCLGTDEVTRSESTTSVTRLKIYLLSMNPSISMYMDSLKSNDIFLVLDNIFFSSLLIPDQLAEPEPSMYYLSLL